MADAIADDLGPWFDRPVALFGHSMGATLGYEVARRLEARGARPLGLFASACRAPSAQRIEYVHQRDDDGLIAALKELSGTDSAVLGDDELLRMVLPAVRGDYTAVETYRHRPGRGAGVPDPGAGGRRRPGDGDRRGGRLARPHDGRAASWRCSPVATST